MGASLPIPWSGFGAAQAPFDPALAPVVEIAIDALTGADSPRLSAPNLEHVLVLSGIEQTLPPIIVQRAGMRVIDGTHRVRAAILRGDATIRAQLFDGTDDEAFLVAVHSNVAHGLPLTLFERKAAAQRILAAHPDGSDRAIAVATGLSDKTVGAVRRRSSAELPQSSTRLGADHRVRPLDVEHRRRVAADLIMANPGAPLREIAGAAGISLGTVRDVRARVSRGEDPVPARRRAGTKELTEMSAAGIPAAARCCAPDPQQRLATLERLRSDPSLRFSAAGRNALRWLFAGMTAPDQWPDVVEAIPSHWAEVVADLARSCADSWQEFASACEGRARRAG